MTQSAATEGGLGFEGKVAIVTGGGAAGDGIGNGRAAALLLAQSGAQVVVVDRRIELAKRTVEDDQRGRRLRAEAHAADVTDEAACQALVEYAVERFGRLDLLDNNVGIGSAAAWSTKSPKRGAA